MEEVGAGGVRRREGRRLCLDIQTAPIDFLDVVAMCPHSAHWAPFIWTFCSSSSSSSFPAFVCKPSRPPAMSQSPIPFFKPPFQALTLTRSRRSTQSNTNTHTLDAHASQTNACMTSMSQFHMQTDRKWRQEECIRAGTLPSEAWNCWSGSRWGNTHHLRGWRC